MNDAILAFPYITLESTSGTSLMAIYVPPFTEGPNTARHSGANADGHVEFYDTETGAFTFVSDYAVTTIADVSGAFSIRFGDDRYTIGPETFGALVGWATDEHSQSLLS